MSRLIEDQIHFLELLRTAKKEQRKALLKTVDKLQLKALSEIAHNVIKGTIVLTPSDRTKLRRFKKIIDILGRKSSTRKERLRVLQRGATAIVQLVQTWKK